MVGEAILQPRGRYADTLGVLCHAFPCPQVYAPPPSRCAPRLRRLSVGWCTITQGITTHHPARSHGRLCHGGLRIASDPRVGFWHGRYGRLHPERRRVHLDRPPHGDGADTPRRVRTTAGRAEAVTRAEWRTV